MFIILKMTGALFVAIGGFLTGNKVKRRLKKRTELLHKYQESLKYADDLIALENMLLEDVLDKCSKRYFSEEKEKNLWEIAYDNLKEKYGTFENIWETSTEEYASNNQFLTSGDIDVLKEIGKALGILSTQRQASHVQGILNELNSLEEKAKRKEEKDGKYALQISLAIAAALIIIMI